MVEPAPMLDINQLLADLLAQKPAAQREFVERFQSLIRRVLRRTVGPGSDIEDLLQEVFFRVFRKLHQVNPPQALPSYVTSITILVAREALRKRRRMRWLVFLDTRGLDERTTFPDEANQELHDFYRILGRMPAISQLLLTLRYVEAMELKEIALAVDMSLATIKRRLAVAEKEFLKRIGKPDAELAPFMRREAL